MRTFPGPTRGATLDGPYSTLTVPLPKDYNLKFVYFSPEADAFAAPSGVPNALQAIPMDGTLQHKVESVIVAESSMSEEGRFKRLKAIFKNAVVWGVSWGALGTVVSALIRLSDGISPGFALLDGIGMGIRIGFMGGLAGAVFSAFISLAYRGRNLSDISAAKFGLGGAIFAGAFVPVFMQTMNLLSGSGFVPFDLINTDILYSALFGGATAAGTMWLAKKDAARNPELSADPDVGVLSPGAAAYDDSRVEDRSFQSRL